MLAVANLERERERDWCFHCVVVGIVGEVGRVFSWKEEERETTVDEVTGESEWNA